MTPNIDWRLGFFLLWGGGVVLVYGFVLYNRFMSYQHHHDRRARRDLGEASGLFITASASAMAIASVLFVPDSASMRGFMSFLSLGAFLGVGIIMATEGPPER